MKNTEKFINFELSSENLMTIFNRCYSKISTEETITIDGVFHSYIFEKEKINSERKYIEMLLSKVSQTLNVGCPFLKLNTTYTGSIWTNNTEEIEKLLVLGIAINKIRFLKPRDRWKSFPNGIPFIIMVN